MSAVLMILKGINGIKYTLGENFSAIARPCALADNIALQLVFLFTNHYMNIPSFLTASRKIFGEIIVPLFVAFAQMDSCGDKQVLSNMSLREET